MLGVWDCNDGKVAIATDRVNHYISVPVVVEAMQWCGWNAEEICEWSGDAVCQQISCGGWPDDLSVLLVNTLEGSMKASLGDFIVKGVLGEFYLCKPAAFYKKYMPLECISIDEPTNKPCGLYVYKNEKWVKVESEVDD